MLSAPRGAEYLARGEAKVRASSPRLVGVVVWGVNGTHGTVGGVSGVLYGSFRTTDGRFPGGITCFLHLEGLSFSHVGRQTYVFVGSD